MAEKTTLARPYAEAAISLAGDDGALDAWLQSLQRMAMAARDDDMSQCIGDPRLTPAQLLELFSSAVGELDSNQRNFIALLIENNRLGVLPEIHQLFVELKNAREDTREAVVSTAFPLDQDRLAVLAGDLERKFGCKVTTRQEAAPELIGGVRIAIGDQVIDASVRGQLDAMAASLKN